MRRVTDNEAQSLTGQLRQEAYCVFDSMVTMGVFEALHPRLGEDEARTYAFERACQAPAMAMMRRGVAVNVPKRQQRVMRLRRELTAKERAIGKMPIVAEVWDGKELETGICTGTGKRHKWPRGEPDETRKCSACGVARQRSCPFNPNSWQQVWHLLYDLYSLPKQKNKKREFSVDEECLERIGRKWPRFQPLTEAILEAKQAKKQIGFLSTRLSPEERFRQSVNVGQTWSGRWSTSASPAGDGASIQNIAEQNRDIFVPDPGWEMGYYDLEQAESRVVAYLAEDEAYIAAHDTGDVHTAVARMLWPNLPWTGNLSLDRKVAEQSCDFDPLHSWRYNAKRSQHGLNYGLSPPGLAAIEHIPQDAAFNVTYQYFRKFPGIRWWQQRVKRNLDDTGVFVNPLGRRCLLFGRRDDPHTYKQALAFLPQSTVADILNVSLWHIWNRLDPERVQLLAQIHDAILFQARIGDDATFRLVGRIMTVPVTMPGGRVMVIPVEMNRGGNWGKREEQNPDGLVKWRE